MNLISGWRVLIRQNTGDISCLWPNSFYLNNTQLGIVTQSSDDSKYLLPVDRRPLWFYLTLPVANNESSEVCGHIFTACNLFNLTLRPGLIMPQTSDDSLFFILWLYLILSLLPGKHCAPRTAHRTTLVSVLYISAVLSTQFNLVLCWLPISFSYLCFHTSLNARLSLQRRLSLQGRLSLRGRLSLWGLSLTFSF